MQIIGHRGARREAPENTLGGFTYLRSLDIHRVELDLHLTRDNQLVVIHDYTTQRTTGKTASVSQSSSSELAQHNAAAQFKNWHQSEPIATLQQVLSAWPTLQSIQLEVKTADVHKIPAIADRLAFIIHEFQLGTKATVTSHDVRVLAQMHERYPHIRRGYVAERFARDPLATCHRLRCEYLVMDYKGLRPAIVEKAHALGMHVSTWTVNDLNNAHRMYEMGVDSLITDVPSLMLKGLHSQFHRKHMHHKMIDEN